MKNKRRKLLWVNGKGVPESRVLAEKALGKPLPKGCEVHHHTDIQLVICQDHAYHFLLHVRTRAFRACGHANWRKCLYCKKYDKLENLKITEHNTYHPKRKPRPVIDLSKQKIIRFMKMVLDK